MQMPMVYLVSLGVVKIVCHESSPQNKCQQMISGRTAPTDRTAMVVRRGREGGHRVTFRTVQLQPQTTDHSITHSNLPLKHFIELIC